MPTVEILKPNIITFGYKQNKDDEDYGTCLWARFNLDLVNYSMSIESDCRNYSYGWTATPETESFFHLCSRFNKDYLLEKFSSKSVINNKETWNKVYQTIFDNLADSENIQILDLSNIKKICLNYSNYNELFDKLVEELKELEELESRDIFDWDTIDDCIVTDYPIGAITIVDIFFEHILPKIKEYEKEQENISEIVHAHWDIDSDGDYFCSHCDCYANIDFYEYEGRGGKVRQDLTNH